MKAENLDLKELVEFSDGLLNLREALDYPGYPCIRPISPGPPGDPGTGPGPEDSHPLWVFLGTGRRGKYRTPSVVGSS